MNYAPHTTSTPPRPMPDVLVEYDRRPSGASRIKNVTNLDPVIAGVHETMAVRLSGTQPKLEALFLERYERMRRMEAARRARLTAA